MTEAAWSGILELAEDYGWNPYGVIVSGQWQALDFEFSAYYADLPPEWGNHRNGGGLVILEDALNLADALERAFLAYEPAYVPTSVFLFNLYEPDGLTRPGIGVILAVIDFCQCGAFLINRYSRTAVEKA
jgi:hypothetical protein